MSYPTSVAVLGGGISGLSAAFHLLRRLKNVSLTLFEGSHRVGGWIQSDQHTLPDGASVVLEAGPRTLRPSPALLELVRLTLSRPLMCLPAAQLYLTGASKHIRAMPRDSPAMRARFLHVPGTPGLTALPSSLRAALSSPLARAALTELLKFPDLQLGDEDESVEAFVARRFRSDEITRLVSAFVHGVYAADARQISARVLFGEAYEFGAPTMYAIQHQLLGPDEEEPHEPYELLPDPPRTPFSLQGGTAVLPASVFAHLTRNDRFAYLPRTHVTAIRPRETGVQLTLHTKAGKPELRNFSHVVSTLPLHTLRAVLPAALRREPALLQTPYNTVTVVNLVFPRTPTPLHPDGFGYLVPRPPGGYESGDGVLGVIFDSCVAPAAVDARVVRLTAMLGGPYPAIPSAPALLATLSRQLGLPAPLPPPLYARAVEARRCIPALAPGHLVRVRDLRTRIGAEFGGRVELAGAGVGGVSVGDCVKSGREAGLAWSGMG